MFRPRQHENSNSPEVRRCVDRISPIGFVGRQAGRGFAVQLQQLERFIIDGAVELIDSLFEFLGIKAKLFCQTLDCVALLWLLIGCVVNLCKRLGMAFFCGMGSQFGYPAWSELLHNHAVGD